MSSARASWFEARWAGTGQVIACGTGGRWCPIRCAVRMARPPQPQRWPGWGRDPGRIGPVCFGDRGRVEESDNGSGLSGCGAADDGGSGGRASASVSDPASGVRPGADGIVGWHSLLGGGVSRPGRIRPGGGSGVPRDDGLRGPTPGTPLTGGAGRDRGSVLKGRDRTPLRPHLDREDLVFVPVGRVR